MAFTQEDIGFHMENNSLKYGTGIILGGGGAGTVGAHYVDEYLEPRFNFFESELGDVLLYVPLAIAGVVAAFYAVGGAVALLHQIAPREKR